MHKRWRGESPRSSYARTEHDVAIFLALSSAILLHCIASPFFGTAEWHMTWRAPEDSVCKQQALPRHNYMPPSFLYTTTTTSKHNIFSLFCIIFFDFCRIFLPGSTLGVPQQQSSVFEAPKLNFYQFGTLLGTPLGAQVRSKFEPFACPRAS